MLSHRAICTPIRSATCFQILNRGNGLYKVHTVVPAGVRILSTSQSEITKATVAPIIEQRKNRPRSPNFAILQPQLTWLMSGFHRFTGGAVAVGFYTGAIAYVAGPYFGLGFDSATVTTTIATVPVAAKVAGKFIIAFPFTFHTLNGTRHLIWDTTKAMTLKGVYATGYAVLGLSTVSAVVLAII
ncbi:cytochrome b subunit of succinate dehydrogenase, Sdh3p [Entomortierella beljakovae]|nr:cytochrome b subunit of succinate dehydrogenase, Sdh3p [Entomortierella beljakovae]